MDLIIVFFIVCAFIWLPVTIVAFSAKSGAIRWGYFRAGMLVTTGALVSILALAMTDAYLAGG